MKDANTIVLDQMSTNQTIRNLHIFLPSISLRNHICATAKSKKNGFNFAHKIPEDSCAFTSSQVPKLIRSEGA